MNNQTKHRIGILGSGESGMGSALLAQSRALDVFLSDSKTIDPEKKNILVGNGILFEENGHSIEKLLSCNEVIKSPGIPDSAAVVVEIRNNNIPVISEIEFASRYSNAKFIGITGSNGKTTTTLLTYHLLKSAGLNVGLGGNIGNSLASLIKDQDYELIVLELSSFQLDGVYEFKADTSMLLNITPDHLDRYNYNLDEYADAKMRITQNQGENELLIHNADDELIQRKIDEKNINSRKFGFSIEPNEKLSALFNGFELKFNSEGQEFSIALGDIPLIGKHNLYNAMAAVLAVMHYGLNKEDIISGLKSFKNAPHRLEYVARIEGVRFINDSKATNVDSVYYALEGMDRDVVWIAGGVNKGNDYSSIKSLVQDKVHALICLGKDNKHLIDEFSDDVEVIVESDDMNDCIQKAVKMAYPGDVVLLSPACASFDLFDNYEQRGDKFRDTVLALKKNFNIKRAIAI